MEVILVVFPNSPWHYSECRKGRRGAASVLLTFISVSLKAWHRWPERHRAFWLWQTWALWLREKGKKNLRRWWVGLRQEELREIWEHVRAFPVPMTKGAESLFGLAFVVWEVVVGGYSTYFELPISPCPVILPWGGHCVQALRHSLMVFLLWVTMWRHI